MSSIKSALAGVVALVLCGAVLPAGAQTQTVGLFLNTPEAQPGYTIVSPIQATGTYLIDVGGHPVHRWATSANPGLWGQLLPNGNLLRAAAATPVPANFRTAAGGGGRMEEYDWDGNLVWSMTIMDQLRYQHHDYRKLENGNILALIWTWRSRDEAIEAGRNPAMCAAGGFWPDGIYEIEPTPPSGGNIVWEWHSWDHYVQEFDRSKDNYGVVADHPELLDINTPTDDGQLDNCHLNGLDYNADLDQILISSRGYNEFWIIDHSTTTAEAAGHSGGRYGRGGDLLYRWGNPEKYGRGTPADKQLHNQHDAQWIAEGLPGEGNILVYDNGIRRLDGSNWSAVYEIVPPQLPDGSYDLAPGAAYGPAAPAWSYPPAADPSFLSPIIAGTQRQPNGNTLICEGTTGRLFEVTADHRKVWEWVNPMTTTGATTQGQSLAVMPPFPLQTNAVFKMRRYPADYPGLAGRDLTPTEVLEIFEPPPPEPDIRAGKVDAAGTQVRMTWDVSRCPATDYNLVYGMLGDVASMTLQGDICALGTGGSTTWTGVPAGNVFILMMGVGDFDIYESSWGTDSFGNERAGWLASNACSVTTKSLAASCP